jgi:peptide/nickel transport system ATP-binding protein/oligopeptide transport system ATP-binding protein
MENPVDPPLAYRFHARCSPFAMEHSSDEQKLCDSGNPQLTRRDAEHPVACHFAQALQIL